MHLKDDWNPTPDKLPSVIPPAGLLLARQSYLYNQIREFCRDGTEDLVCPLLQQEQREDALPTPPPKRSQQSTRQCREASKD